jgi:hypothetical protein
VLEILRFVFSIVGWVWGMAIDTFLFRNLIEFPVGPVGSGLTEDFIKLHPFIVLSWDFPELNQSQIILEFGFDCVKQARNVPESIASEIDNIS